MDSPDSYRGKFPKLIPLQMCFVYVITSSIDDSYYVGSTQNLEERLRYHNDPIINTGVTRLKIPWSYSFVLQTPSKTVALKIERHIKRMKSRNFISNLIKYPELGEKLLKKYS
jgi:putative endonuclease